MDPLVDYYTNRAPEYESIWYRDDPVRQGEQTAMALAIEAGCHGRRVLEVACGTGYWTRFAAAAATEVVALDLSPKMLALARAKNLVRATFIEGNAYEVANVPGPFTAGLANFWFSHIPKRRIDEFLHCAGCGQRRLADQKGRCPKCGSRKYRRPGLSKVALWAISAFFVGVAVFYLAGALQARHKNGRYLAEAAGWLLVAAMVVAGACGARVNKLLRYFSDLEFDADFDRLSRHPQLARRILILIMSVGVFVLAIQRLLSH